MAVPISNVTRRQVYSPSGAGGAGPYSFTFEILANTDIAVYKDDTLLTLTTHYTVTINANGTGSVTITAAGLALSPTSPTQYAIVGNRTIQRTSDFTTGGDFFANTINDELDQQTIFAQQNSEGLQRALTAPQTDPTSIDMTLPRASVRANKTLAFDSNGDPTTGEVIGDNRGNWSAAVAYNKRDIVKDTSNGNVYYANTSHTSSGSQPISTNADSAKWDLIVDNASAGSSATAAAASASAAATSASNASTSASNASTSATNAAASASTASTQASNASTSATNAAASASTASTQASNASTSATNAAASASTASTQASNASTSASNASTSATNAANSASTATTQATNASNSASAASTSASNASTSATNAANSATASASSATSAAASAAAAAASFDAFDDIYLGAKSSDPSVDNDGNALTTGDQYFNTTANELRVYNGSTWQAASTVGGTVTNLTVTNGASIQGLTVGRGAGAVSNNTAVGLTALAANTTGSRNSGFGAYALYVNTTGANNTAVGHASMFTNTTGIENSAVGDSALRLNTTGSNNSAFGTSALYSNTTASNNTAIGYQAGYSNTTGAQLTALGVAALYNNTTGSNNTAVGREALLANTTGLNNTATGANSLLANTTGSYNTSIGQQSLYSNTTASNNTAVGYQAGYTQTGTTQDNTYLGYQAGYTNTARSNAFLGAFAGYAATSGGFNTFVGCSAGDSVTSGSKNTILGRYNGNQNSLDIRTASNYIVLSDGDGNPKLQIDNSTGGNIFWLGERIENSSSNNLVVNNANSIRINIDCDNNNPDGESFVIGKNQRSIDNNNKLFEVLETGTVVLPFGQIKFPATQNASSDANTLDDYEEGLWTPAFSSTGATFSYANQFGSYVKIGQMVLAQVYINATASGTTTNDCLLTGLPFTSSTANASFAQYGAGVWSTSTIAVNPLVNANGATTVTLWKQGSVSIQTAADMSGKYLVGTIMYRSNS